MALKRKRSSPSFSPPSSDATHSDASGSPYPLPFFYAQSKPTEPFFAKPSWSFPTYESDDGREHASQPAPSSRHLNSRTRKRHRDDRPDEKSVFASTLSRLYDAQRALPRAEPTPSQPAANVRVEEPAQRSTLHSFWNIGGSAPMVVDAAPSTVASDPEARCEDCEGSLRPPDGMDLDDAFVVLDTACSSCRRHVCDGCAVLGNERICLACASRRAG